MFHIVMGYGLDGRGSILGRARYFSLLRSVQTGSGPDPASYSVGTSGSLLGPRREANHSPPYSAEMELHLHSPTRLQDVVLN
jgi:hypothetical protein